MKNYYRSEGNIMRKRNLIILLFTQIFIMSTIIIASTSSTLNQWQSWSNIIVNNKISKRIPKTIPKDRLLALTEQEPIWSYSTGGNISSVAISEDG